MRLLHARARNEGPDSHTLAVMVENDPTFYFHVRRSTVNGSLVPVGEDDKAIFVIEDKQVEGELIGNGIWSFDLRSADISLNKKWRVDSIVDGRRTTHAVGSFAYSR